MKMAEKKKPRGFVATCQCGRVVGAMDYDRTDRAEAGKLLGKWLADGCTVAPKFTGSWSVHVEACDCDHLAKALRPNVGANRLMPRGNHD